MMFYTFLHVFQIFTTALEKVTDFNDFTDFCSQFELLRGKSTEEEESNVVGQFKVCLLSIQTNKIQFAGYRQGLCGI